MKNISVLKMQLQEVDNLLKKTRSRKLELTAQLKQLNEERMKFQKQAREEENTKKLEGALFEIRLRQYIEQL